MQTLPILMPLVFACVIYTYRYLRLYRLITSTPLSTTATAKTGPISIEGKTRKYKNESAIAPSKKSCVWYTYTARRLLRTFVPNKGFSTTPFLIEDNTGAIVINPPRRFIFTDLQYITTANENGSAAMDTWNSISAYALFQFVRNPLPWLRFLISL